MAPETNRDKPLQSSRFVFSTDFYTFLFYNGLGWLAYFLGELVRNIYVEPERFKYLHDSILYCSINSILGFLFTVLTYNFLNIQVNKSIEVGTNKTIGLVLFVYVIISSFLVAELSFLFSPVFPNKERFPQDILAWKTQLNQFRAWFKWMLIWILFFYFVKYFNAFFEERKQKEIEVKNCLEEKAELNGKIEKREQAIEHNIRKFELAEEKIAQENTILSNLNESLKTEYFKTVQQSESLKDNLNNTLSQLNETLQTLLDKQETIDQLYKTIEEGNAKILGHQMDAHMLFNILNTIRAKINLGDPVTAATMISKLSDLLRYIIYKKEVTVSLAEELDIVKKYIYIEQQRWGNKLNYNFDAKSFGLIDEHKVKIPPLLLQTLLENGIKHGIAKTIGGGELKLTMKVDENYIRIVICNPGVYIEKEFIEGRGLEMSRKRLSEAFNDPGVGITIENASDGEKMVTTEFIIPYEQT